MQYFIRRKNVIFHKMHGLGNDVIITEAHSISSSDQIQLLCDRKKGIGADQLVTYSPDLDVRFFNQDGSAAEQCGNGIRCLAWFLMKEKKTDFITLKTTVGMHRAWLLPDEQVRIEMGTPLFLWEDQPLSHQLDFMDVFVGLSDRPDMASVSMGNPHAIIFVKETSLELAEKYGPFVEHHKLFPNKTNAHFVTVLDRNTIHMVPWERGTGITFACGSGACAVHAAAYKKELVNETSLIKMPGGDLKIEYRDDKVIATGHVTYVFEGRLK